MITVCLNGDRARGQHPALPVTPTEAAAAGAAAVVAGAAAVHVHPRGADGSESFHTSDIVATVLSLRRVCPGVPVGVSTRDGVAADARTKLALVGHWPAPGDGGPDLASVNWHEAGAEAVAEALAAKGIGVEVGLWTPEAARRCLASGWVDRCQRVLVELVPGHSGAPDVDPCDLAGEVLAVLPGGIPSVLVHGEEHWAWPVLRWAQSRGLDLRIGLEDTLLDERGATAVDNAALVREAAAEPPSTAVTSRSPLPS
jgi:uncharacterized protein (DUF849 family)